MADKKLYAARDFDDAGTGKSFARGNDISSEPGVGNYAAAGLTTDKKLEATKDAPAA